ncbi:hypothetical protein [Wolinella succinogenes]|uniref:Uncharacterized protein n=1 Tax=Wolinella succinogenes (strain ATCC 29543 / DSM 1740 / CCUG 13145 / JCM 31913 / LMG 7466 / NCTC 11488 / FDC 602W) TaxID=273121 RepID=Q7MR17_WOLSU|nr:hypothetical protein [Wolinella succinogenes]CAE10815.1 hypothetical protein WS1797 [Wolinella succinogenes]VEG80970.1 Uncharacterised protein [Wolinella succinogenes]HCZ18534.1 hypothetical protein [Helicobacter sp.]
MRKILAFWGWLALTLPLLAADPQCSAVFSNAVGVTTYNLTANSGAKLYNTEDNSNVINVGSLSGVSTICQGGAATCVVNSHAPLMTIPNAPIFGSLIGYTLNSGQNDTLSFNTTRSSFTINGTLNLNGNIYLNSKNLLGTAQSFSLNNGGVLNINGNVTIYASTLTLNGTININSGSLTLIVDSFNYNSGAKINGNNTYDKVVILARNSIAINDSIPAILYSNGSATVNSQGVVYGALTAGSIMLNGTIHYIQSATTSAEIPGCTNNFSGSNLRAFTRAYQTSLNGGIKIIGNTILGQKNSNSTICPTNNTNNAEVTLRYWDIDSDSSTFSSSSSTLTLTSNSEIVKAYLYWQGILSAGNKAEAQSVKLKTPTQTSYVEITSQTSKFNWAEQNYSGYYYSYQGVADVTSYVKESGVYTVADLSTTQGTINQLGSFGAWAIVVVYRNNSETFKNITLFDGYDIVSSGNNKSYTLSGFLTPTKGTVKSSFLTFTGEGDVDITGDYIQLGGTRLKNINGVTNNAFDASITEGSNYFTAKNPNCQNNFGIDIHDFDVGSSGQNIINNSQSSVGITLGSTQDTYFPGLFAFSTDLYVPDVCYEENLTKNGIEPTSIVIGDTLDINVTISNMNYEPAKGVSIAKFFNTSLEYDKESTQVRNSTGIYVPKTDAGGDDVVTYSDKGNEQKLRINLGTGASASGGGTIGHEQEEAFYYRFKVQQDGNLTNEYKVSYRDESDPYNVVEHSEIAIGKCSNRNITSSIITVSPLGKARIVERGAGWSTNGGSLSTKISGDNLAFDLLYATDSSGATLATGVVKKVELYDYSNPSTPVLVRSLITSDRTINQRYEIPAFSMTARAYQDLRFQITLSDGTIATSNNFALRPHRFEIAGTTPTTPKAGEPFTLTIKALDTLGNPTAGYNQALSLSLSPKLTFNEEKSECKKGNLKITGHFVDGVFTSDAITYDEIGRINLQVSEVTGSEWGINDALDTPEETRYITPSEVFPLGVVPSQFSLESLALTSEFGDFSYFDAPWDKALKLDYTLTAQNAEGKTTENYSAQCYAKEVTVKHTLNPAITETRDEEKENVNVRTSATTAPFDGATLPDLIAPQSGFTKGEQSITHPFTFTTINRKKPKSPFFLSSATQTLKLSASDGTTQGEGEVSTPMKLFFGRINPIDSTNTAKEPAKVYYEVYCRGSDCASFGLSKPSVNSAYWYQNPKHASPPLEMDHFTSTTKPNPSGGIGSLSGASQNLEFVLNEGERKRVDITHGDEAGKFPLYLHFHPYSTTPLTSFFVSRPLEDKTVEKTIQTNETTRQTKGASRIGE